MKFIALLNKDIGAGLAVNALAQMSLGLGHRLQGYPDVHVFWGTTEQVRQFRTIANAITPMHPDTSVYSDFPHTMQGGDTTSLLDGVINTPEADTTYFASCMVAPEIHPSIENLTRTCLQLNDYQPYVSQQAASLLPAGPGIEKEDGHMKTTTLINKLPLAQTLNQVVLANLDVGKKAPYDALHILRIGGLQGISFNTHPVLRPDSSAKHKSMADSATKTSEIWTSTHSNAKKEPLVTVTFGTRYAVETVISRKVTRAFDVNLDKEGLHQMNPSASASASTASVSASTVSVSASTATSAIEATLNPSDVSGLSTATLVKLMFSPAVTLAADETHTSERTLSR